jgi:prepilin peptidase CpaA
MVSVMTTILIVLTTLIASIYDVRWRIIPNFITLPAIIAGVCVHTFAYGFEGLLNSLLGIVFGSAFFLILFLFNWMGAGDVKLAAAIGALLGGSEIIFVVFLTTICGGILGIIYLILNKVKTNKINNSVPYGVAISFGAFLYLTLS